MSRNRLERLSEPSPYPVGSWRWLLLKPVVPVRWDGRGTLPEGVAHGDIAHYHRLTFRDAVMWKFPRLHHLWHRATVVHWKCGCSHRWWSRKTLGMRVDCERHGFPARYPEEWQRMRERGTLRGSEQWDGGDSQ